MDARSNLARFLVFYAHMSQDDAEQMVQQALNEELHEAAEKIRMEAGECEGWPQKQRDLRFAAHLIDSKREKS